MRDDTSWLQSNFLESHVIGKFDGSGVSGSTGRGRNQGAGEQGTVCRQLARDSKNRLQRGWKSALAWWRQLTITSGLAVTQAQQAERFPLPVIF